MNKKALYIGAGVLVLAGIGFIIWKNSKKEKPISLNHLQRSDDQPKSQSRKMGLGRLGIVRKLDL